MRDKRMYVSAYMTLEAALIMPLVFAVVTLIIYMWFFQYDRCLMEQDINAVTLKASSIWTNDNKKRYELLNQYVEEIYAKKYIAWSYGIKYGIQKNKVNVSMDGALKFPFGESGFTDQPAAWNAKAENTGSILSPGFVVRQVRKGRIAKTKIGGME